MADLSRDRDWKVEASKVPYISGRILRVAKSDFWSAESILLNDFLEMMIIPVRYEEKNVVKNGSSFFIDRVRWPKSAITTLSSSNLRVFEVVIGN